jgi:hypothetical protein
VTSGRESPRLEWYGFDRYSSTRGLESLQGVRIWGARKSLSQRSMRDLSELYWVELGRVTRGVVRARRDGETVRLVLAGALSLLRFHAPVVGEDACRYPIAGGLLAARPGGTLEIARRDAATLELEVSVRGYHPRLEQLLHARLQAPLHRAVSRRYLARAVRG